MTSCIAQVLCIFAASYGDYLDPICHKPELIVELISQSPASIPSEFVKEECAVKDLAQAEEWLVNTTQQQFRARAQDQERGEAKIPEWINLHADKIIKLTTELNFIAEKAPQVKQYDCAAIFGSTTPMMEKETNYLIEKIDAGLKIDKLFLLAGERYIDEKKYYDGTPSYLKQVAVKFAVPENALSERELFQDVYDRKCASNDKCKAIQYELIYSAKSEKIRADTEGTIKDFNKHKNECAHTVFISAAPFTIAQQEMVARTVDREIDYEVIGPAAKAGEAPSKEKAAHYILMSVAEGLYAAKDRVRAVIREMAFKNEL